MKSLKITLVGLVALLAVAVAYGYGCGSGDDTSGGGNDTPAAESGDTSAGAASTDSGDGGGETGDGGGETGDGGNGGSDGDGEAGGGNGGDGAGGDGAGAPLSKAVFIKQGDAICARVPQRYGEQREALEKANQAAGKAKTSTAEATLRAAIPPLYTAIEELEKLSPPSGEEQRVEAIIDSLGAAAKGLEEKPTSELTGPKSPFAEFQKLTK